ncbi:MAG: S41 family peptidase [Candidatus Promineifilaceae bacterium]
MSSNKRDLLTILMVFLLVILSFATGFLVNELIETRYGRGPFNDMGDEFSVFWEAWDRIGGNYIGEVPTNQDLTYGATHGSIRVLDDPYTIFVEPVAREQERERLRGNFGGVGVELSRDENGIFILEPIPGNPAEEAGVLSGDILIAVDDHELTPETTVQEVAELVRGEEGTQVVLTVLHQGSDEPIDISVTRATILMPSVSFRILPQDDSIGYIRLSSFTGESGKEIEEAILSLRQDRAEYLILDLRQNGGGLRDAAVDISEHFLDGGTVVFQASKDGDEQEFVADKGEIAEGIPVVVLVDDGTASAAEIVAGALQDRERATLIGSPTFGKGSVQLVFDLSDGSSVHVTSARWLTPNRKQLDQQGLQPDILVELTQDAIDSGIDEILERAITFLQQS